MRKKILMFAAVVAVLSAGCSRQHGLGKVVEIEKSDSLPKSVKEAVRAIADNDSDRFAAIVSYPLSRPYPLKDIADDKEMRAYYSEMIDDSLKQIITGSGPEKWSADGWRGWTIDEGRYLWIDDKIYEVNYLSAKEKQKLQSLIAEEIASLPTDLRDGWWPESCHISTNRKTIYRLDRENTTGKIGKISSKERKRKRGRKEKVDSYGYDSIEQMRYRLSIYDTLTDLRGAPTKILLGRLEREGTAGTQVYYFDNQNGLKAIFERDLPDSEFQRISITDTLRGETVDTLTTTYWRDLINK